MGDYPCKDVPCQVWGKRRLFKTVCYKPLVVSGMDRRQDWNRMGPTSVTTWVQPLDGTVGTSHDTGIPPDRTRCIHWDCTR